MVSTTSSMVKSTEHCAPGAKVLSSQFKRAVPVSCNVDPVRQSGINRPHRGSTCRFPNVMNIELPR
ncbi:Uncharacterised protein [Mycobacteroides abscessus subsp. bolletii]|uniref:Uncharacterized protein n=1 Tax=Mycobacteroides abscessus subsp. bolletii TaxID=319705 RepID=A0A9Q7SEB8_9MYCO|nr:Uncharacterised protein [Mycobacteroides abscessus subsp. bolletii]SHT99614.1 Uncharacterised protein [Mycobacteroides abscessus subsp. bolletii]SHX45358.1 Uncharacterised protein [Mycobacteroides abscessus subsp. bolletii]SKM60609.1 Uncharacterised protein [Mycobacteroides abscessus subsp. bolletii]SKN36855.1 Uncharacterised protein [Mycobacteroides abscessus subsp. bolletii]